VWTMTLVTTASRLIVQLALDDLVSPRIHGSDVLLAIPVHYFATSIDESVLNSSGRLEFEPISALVLLSSL
jgi:hypothetical protein